MLVRHTGVVTAGLRSYAQVEKAERQRYTENSTSASFRLSVLEVRMVVSCYF